MSTIVFLGYIQGPCSIHSLAVGRIKLAKENKGSSWAEHLHRQARPTQWGNMVLARTCRNSAYIYADSKTFGFWISAIMQLQWILLDREIVRHRQVDRMKGTDSKACKGGGALQFYTLFCNLKKNQTQFGRQWRKFKPCIWINAWKCPFS